MITHQTVRTLFSEFWQKRGHKEVPPIPLVPKDDPTTLFTGSGMQQLVPNLLGEPHPLGEKLYNIQPCFRAQDIEEVGDNRHTTFFEMMGNWSLGTYFKKEQITWVWRFFTEVLRLPKERLYVSVFEGTKDIPEDRESHQLWKSLGVPENKIFKYGPEKNWWSRAGIPDNMPPGEPGGPDTEVFYDFGPELKIHEQSEFKDQPCHPNCDCGRFGEIGNSVFMQYKKNSDGTFSELPKKNVDFGGGLERILAALNNDPDVFKTDVFSPIIKRLEKDSGKPYLENELLFRVIIDHLKAAGFIIKAGVEVGNKGQGYVLRRLIRRSVVKMMEINIIPQQILPGICSTIVGIFDPIYFQKNDSLDLHTKIGEEIDSFEKTVNRGIKILKNQTTIDGKALFNLKQSYGFPLELALEMLSQWGKKIDKQKVIKEFNDENTRHKSLSRNASSGMFKGGLADHSERVLKYHTATHLLHQALFDVLGNEIRQEGSNITGERLRFDYHSPTKPTPEQIKQIETIVNEKIRKSLPVEFKIMPKEEAYKIGAKSFFREKYPEKVKVYFIGNYSKEFCGGPHVKNTSEIGPITIFKSEKIGSNLYRIYAR